MSYFTVLSGPSPFMRADYNRPAAVPSHVAVQLSARFVNIGPVGTLRQGNVLTVGLPNKLYRSLPSRLKVVGPVSVGGF
jgi:hypothetical protein